MRAGTYWGLIFNEAFMDKSDAKVLGKEKPRRSGEILSGRITELLFASPLDVLLTFQLRRFQASN